MSSRWKKKHAPQVGQIWRHNAYRILNQPLYLILFAARVGHGRWELTVFDMERGGRHMIDVRRDHQEWERVV
jgi:hypothetical protein